MPLQQSSIGMNNWLLYNNSTYLKTDLHFAQLVITGAYWVGHINIGKLVERFSQWEEPLQPCSIPTSHQVIDIIHKYP